MKRSRGAVPIIATMLLLVIVSATVLVVYAYVSGSTVLPDSDQQTGRMLEKLKTVEVKGYEDGHYSVFILNTGDVDSVIDTFYVKNFTGNTLVAIPVNEPIAVGEVKEFIFDPYLVGQDPWAWFEILGITQRGNKVQTNLYGFFTGAYEIGEAPIGGEHDYPYSPSDVTVNGTSTNPANLANLTGIDANYFGYPGTNWVSQSVSYPSSVYDLNVTSDHLVDHTSTEPGDDIDDLSDLGASGVLHFNINPHGGDYFLSSVFNGTATNLEYPNLILTLVFGLQSSGYSGLSGLVQFYDYNLNEYVTSGDGYYSFSNGDTLPNANAPANPTYKNWTVSMSSTGLLGPHGEWSIRLNMTNTAVDNLRLDYFRVAEYTSYAYPFHTVFWYQANSVVNETNVISILFSTTGIFPQSSIAYKFEVYDFDINEWVKIGTFQGSSSEQTCIYMIESPCSSYIQSQLIQARIIPFDDLPLGETIQINQARIIIRQT